MTAHTEELAVVEPRATPMPVFSGAEMTAALNAYQALQSALDKAMPDAIMTIAGKQFRKKQYWRSVRTAFNLTVEVVKEERTEVVKGTGSLDWGWLVTYRATAPTGRFADGDGCCYASEKQRGRMEATEHNVRSHAHTRAFNRAVSNLVGFGEVSAEEVERDKGDNGMSATLPADGLLRIAEVQQRHGKSANGRTWTLNVVKFTDGREGSTFDEDVAKLALRCKNELLVVEPLLEPSQKKPGQFELKEIQIATVKPMSESDDGSIPF